MAFACQFACCTTIGFVCLPLLFLLFMLFMLWLHTDFFLLIWYNLACAIGVIIMVNKTIVSELILSCIYVPFLSVFYFLIYRRLYKAMRVYNIHAYYAYCFGFIFTLGVSIVGTVGPKMSGFMGFLWAEAASGKSTHPDDYPHVTMCSMCYANGVLFAISSAFQLYDFLHVYIALTCEGGMRTLAVAQGGAQLAPRRAV